MYHASAITLLLSRSFSLARLSAVLLHRVGYVQNRADGLRAGDREERYRTTSAEREHGLVKPEPAAPDRTASAVRPLEVAIVGESAPSPEMDLRPRVEGRAQPRSLVRVPRDTVVRLPRFLLHLFAQLGVPSVFGGALHFHVGRRLRRFRLVSAAAVAVVTKRFENGPDHVEREGELAL